mmetsp:Transcript_16595/g.39227  ORF Transcript_16595/g.39227 Transcript_16595/m.39227 type:complete len:572 (+) Transcript_16595:68-1783(+)
MWKFLSIVFQILLTLSDGFDVGLTQTRRRYSSVLAVRAHRNAFHQQYLHDTNENEGVYVATCIPGLSSVLADELQAIGAPLVEKTGNAAVRFTADTETALRALIWCRTPHKIMELLCESPPTVQTRDDLYHFVRETVPVKDLVGDGKGGLLTLSVSTLLNNPSRLPKDINHSHYTALTVKNAICDEVRDLRGDRPDVSTENPDLPLVAVVRGMSSGRAGGGESNVPPSAQFSLFRQIHHGSLHRRGYRSTIHKAAMKESLAAGLLLNAEWHKQCAKHKEQHEEPLVLIDPMAGSGTLLLEGMFIAGDVAPHVLRLKCGLEPALAHQFPPITRWKHGKMSVGQLWKDLLLEASQKAKNGLRYLKGVNNNKRPMYFVANDFHGGALDLLDESMETAGVGDLVNVQEAGCREFVPRLPQDISSTPWTVVCNPPWGVRLTEEIEESWESLRVFLRETCPEGTMAHVLSGNAKATKHLGLRRSASLPIQVGTVQMRWIQYLMQKPEKRKDFAFANVSSQQHSKESPPLSVSRNSRQPPESSYRRPIPVSLPKPKPKKKQKVAAAVPSDETNEWLID